MKVNHLEELDGMRSVVDMSIDTTPGEDIGLTVDHRSHPGYLLLAHEDEQVVEEEYNHIVNNIQDSLFEVVPSKATNYYGTSGTSGISSIISGSSSSSSSTDKNGNGNWKGVERGGGKSAVQIHKIHMGIQDYSTGHVGHVGVRGLWNRVSYKIRRTVASAAIIGGLSYVSAAVYVLFGLPKLEE